MENKEIRKYLDSKVNILWGKLSLYGSRVVQVKFLEKKLREKKSEIQEAGEVKAINFGSEHSQNPVELSSIYNRLIAEESEIEKELYMAKAKVRELETIRNLIEDDVVREMVTFKFFKNKKWDWMETKYLNEYPFMGKHGIENCIRRELKKIVGENKDEF